MLYYRSWVRSCGSVITYNLFSHLLCFLSHFSLYYCHLFSLTSISVIIFRDYTTLCSFQASSQDTSVSAVIYAVADWWLSTVCPAPLWLFSEFGAVYKYSLTYFFIYVDIWILYLMVGMIFWYTASNCMSLKHPNREFLGWLRTACYQLGSKQAAKRSWACVKAERLHCEHLLNLFKQTV